MSKNIVDGKVGELYAIVIDEKGKYSFVGSDHRTPLYGGKFFDSAPEAEEYLSEHPLFDFSDKKPTSGKS